MSAKAHVWLGVILAIAAIGQVILSFVLYDQDGVDWARNLGWILPALSMRSNPASASLGMRTGIMLKGSPE